MAVKEAVETTAVVAIKSKASVIRDAYANVAQTSRVIWKIRKMTMIMMITTIGESDSSDHYTDCDLLPIEVITDFEVFDFI